MARRRRVRFAGNGEAATAATQEPKAPEASQLDLPPLSEAPTGVLRLRSATGDVIEAPTVPLWRRSPLVRELLEEDGSGEELPLPSVSTCAVTVLLKYCEWAEASGSECRGAVAVPPLFSELPLTMLLELQWVARLLDVAGLGAALVLALADGLQSGRWTCQTLDELSPEMLLAFSRDCISILPASKAFHLLGLLARRLAPELQAPFVDALAPYLRHRSRETREEAGRVLRAIGSLGAFRAVLEYEDDFSSRADAARMLVAAGPVALPLVFDLLKSESWQVREAAADMLPRLAPPGDLRALQAAGTLLEDPSREVRGAAVSALRDLATPGSAEAADEALRRLNHPEMPVRCIALRALAAVVGCDAPQVQEAAERLQAETATMARHAAARVLGHSRPREEARQAEVCVKESGMPPAVWPPPAYRAGRWGDSDDDIDDEAAG